MQGHGEDAWYIYIYIYYKKANELLLSVKEMMEDKVMDIKPTRCVCKFTNKKR